MDQVPPRSARDRAGPNRDPGSRDSRVGPVSRWMLRRVIDTRGDLPLEIELWDGQRFEAPGGAAIARMRLRDRSALLALVTNPETGFGDSYVRGGVEIEGDLSGLLDLAFRRQPRAEGWEWRVARLASRFVRRNSMRGSRTNIHRHYDLGNDFYARWLDERMVYTCAYFPSPDVSLEQAQLAKLDHVCRKLRLRPGERVLEVGCGWGALAIHMAARYGCRVRAFNISHEQITWARDKAKELGMVGRVEFVEDDYRNAAGRYDAFVSVGMLEHVGRQNYPILAAVIDRCLEPHGRGFLHSIGRARPLPIHPWIERNIFPGSYPPTLQQMVKLLEDAGVVVLDVENLRLHYARTLEHWLDRFAAHAEALASEFDPAFVRKWQLYLASSIASFRAGSLHLFQVLFSRTANNEIPWTRAHAYREG